MRFRLVLPVLSVILAVILLRVGDMQIEKFLDGRRPGRGGEPVPDSYARAKYFDYALNAPAWATLGEERGMLWHRSTANKLPALPADAIVVAWFYSVLLLLFVTGFLQVDGLHCFGSGSFSK